MLSSARSKLLNRRFRLAALCAVALLLGAGSFALRLFAPPEPTVMSVSALDDAVAAGRVDSAVMVYETETVEVTLSDGARATVDLPLRSSDAWAGRLVDAGVSVTVEKQPPPSILSRAFTMVFPFVGIALMMLLVLRGMRGSFSIGRSKRVTTPSSPPDTRFSDVAGVPEVCEQLRDVVLFLKDPTRFSPLGARLPRGVLLVGPPGTGKTLVARATAGEAGVPFFALAGSDFAETFVGVGAARIRDLFKAARSAGRAIIFIDEIDSVGRNRSAGVPNGATDEADRTLNMLLSEMDGFHGRDGIVVIAATNRPDILDPALRRPGRFDRSITVPAPDLAGRQQLLKHFATRYRHDDVDLGVLAARTPGMTGADLDALWNEAAITAAKSGRDTVRDSDLDAALATLMMGPERRSRVLTDRQKQIVAWHEAGHTAAAMILPACDNPLSVSIVPRGDAGGATWYGVADERFITRDAAYARLRVLLAGRAAERLLLDGEFTQGASDDLVKASQLAYEMTASWGMTPLGEGDFTAGSPWGRPLAERVADQVRLLLAAATEDVQLLLAAHGALVAEVARRLLDHETLTAAQIDDLARAHTGCASCSHQNR